MVKQWFRFCFWFNGFITRLLRGHPTFQSTFHHNLLRNISECSIIGKPYASHGENQWAVAFVVITQYSSRNAHYINLALCCFRTQHGVQGFLTCVMVVDDEDLMVFLKEIMWIHPSPCVSFSRHTKTGHSQICCCWEICWAENLLTISHFYPYYTSEYLRTF
jgi:hypothetical protein